jgi:hypothetical protein
MFAALLEHSDCGRRRVVGSLALAADDPDPDARSHRAVCVLVVSAPEAAPGDAARPPGARLAVFLAGDAG